MGKVKTEHVQTKHFQRSTNRETSEDTTEGSHRQMQEEKAGQLGARGLQVLGVGGRGGGQRGGGRALVHRAQRGRAPGRRHAAQELPADTRRKVRLQRSSKNIIYFWSWGLTIF